MQSILPVLLVLTSSLASCFSHRQQNYEYTEHQQFFAVMSKLEKHPNNKKARKALPAAYDAAYSRSMQEIIRIGSGASLDELKRIRYEYIRLQNMHDRISGNAVAAGLVNAVNHKKENDSMALVVQAGETAAAAAEYRAAESALLNEAENLRHTSDLGKWKQLLSIYEQLNSLNEKIYRNQRKAAEQLQLADYERAIRYLKQEAAEAWYKEGLKYVNSEKRSSLRYACDCFDYAKWFIPGFRDSDRMQQTCRANAIVNVLVLPVVDRSFSLAPVWAYRGAGYGHENFQQALVNDLNQAALWRHPAIFFLTPEGAGKNSREVWEARLSIENLDIPSGPAIEYSNEQRSESIVTGRDTAGRNIYQTVTATMQTAKAWLKAEAVIKVVVVNKTTGYQVYNKNAWASFSWNNETYSFTGDYRALNVWDRSKIDRVIILPPPSREEITGRLYRDLYDRTKSHILEAVKW